MIPTVQSEDVSNSSKDWGPLTVRSNLHSHRHLVVPLAAQPLRLNLKGYSEKARKKKLSYRHTHKSHTKIQYEQVTFVYWTLTEEVNLFGMPVSFHLSPFSLCTHLLANYPHSTPSMTSDVLTGLQHLHLCFNWVLTSVTQLGPPLPSSVIFLYTPVLQSVFNQGNKCTHSGIPCTCDKQRGYHPR